jgi:hypothetical protein
MFVGLALMVVAAGETDHIIQLPFGCPTTHCCRQAAIKLQTELLEGERECSTTTPAPALLGMLLLLLPAATSRIMLADPHKMYRYLTRLRY